MEVSYISASSKLAILKPTCSANSAIQPGKSFSMYQCQAGELQHLLLSSSNHSLDRKFKTVNGWDLFHTACFSQCFLLVVGRMQAVQKNCPLSKSEMLCLKSFSMYWRIFGLIASRMCYRMPAICVAAAYPGKISGLAKVALAGGFDMCYWTLNNSSTWLGEPSGMKACFVHYYCLVNRRRQVDQRLLTICAAAIQPGTCQGIIRIGQLGCEQWVVLLCTSQILDLNSFGTCYRIFLAEWIQYGWRAIFLRLKAIKEVSSHVMPIKISQMVASSQEFEKDH